jgi:hypothetical protein
VKEWWERNIPLLAPPQGGVAERLIKIAKLPLTRGRGGFPIESKTAAAARSASAIARSLTSRKTTYGFALSRSRFAPGCVCFGGFATFY